jgi:hypothetical protein
LDLPEKKILVLLLRKNQKTLKLKFFRNEVTSVILVFVRDIALETLTASNFVFFVYLIEVQITVAFYFAGFCAN